MAKKVDIYHSVLLVSSSEQFDIMAKKSFAGFITIDIRKSFPLARQCVFERYYDLVVINLSTSTESGVSFAIDVADKCNASILLVVASDIYEDVMEKVTDKGVLVIHKNSSQGQIDMAIRFLVAQQNKIHGVEKKRLAAEEKLEEMRMVNKAKFWLIESEGMTEDEAHKYIGKVAMNNGISRGKAAVRILDDAD